MADDADHHGEEYLSSEFESLPVRPVSTAASEGTTSTGPGPVHRRRTLAPYAIAGVAYLALSIVLWWHVWSGHPAGTSSCECGDPSLFIWFLEWPAYALTHGHWLFFTSVDFHGRGLNLLSNTSVLGIGVPLMPVTWLFGPVATLNVASTLAPALSALSMFWVARRWVRWTPAAFVAGLLYGFSPFVLMNAAYGHLTLTTLVVPPLVLACLDELVIRQQHRPGRVGAALGLLLVYQFFLSTEILLIVVVTIVLGLVVIGVYAFYAHPEEIARRAPHAGRGLGVGIALSAVLLAYPAWYAVAGPQHFSGLIWPDLRITSGYSWNAYIDPALTAHASPFAQVLGYLGTPFPSPPYVGWGIPIVLCVGLIAWRKDRRLWFFAALGLVTAACSLGQLGDELSIWWIVNRLPLLEDVGEERFSAVCFLLVAVMLGIVIDHLHTSLVDRQPPTGAVAHARRTDPAARGERQGWLRHYGAVNAAVTTGAAIVLALGPLLWVLAPSLPYTVETDHVPAWFTQVAPRLPPGQVVLTYPAPFSAMQDSLTWQALGARDEHFVFAGGGGPESLDRRAGSQAKAQSVLANLSYGVIQEDGRPAQLAQVRGALRAWGVTVVVVPRSLGLPVLFGGKSPAYDVGFMTAALGEPPTFQDGSWVWTSVDRAPPPLRLPAGTVPTCGNGRGAQPSSPPSTVPNCVMAAAQPTVG